MRPSRPPLGRFRGLPPTLITEGLVQVRLTVGGKTNAAHSYHRNRNLIHVAWYDLTNFLSDPTDMDVNLTETRWALRDSDCPEPFWLSDYSLEFRDGLSSLFLRNSPHYGEKRDLRAQKDSEYVVVISQFLLEGDSRVNL